MSVINIVIIAPQIFNIHYPHTTQNRNKKIQKITITFYQSIKKMAIYLYRKFKAHYQKREGLLLKHMSCGEVDWGGD